VTVQVQKRVHNGATFYELMKVLNDRADANAIINDTEKLLYPHSYFTVDLVTDSYKYDKQLQFKSWSYRPPTVVRRNDTDGKTYRLECGFLPVNRNTVMWLKYLANKIETFLDTVVVR